MKGFAKIILAAVAGLAALLLLVWFGVNLYLQSGDVQQRIRLATEQALGMPVTVKRTLYTPWSGLTLSGLSLPDPTIPGANLVDAPKFSVQFEFFPLLGRRLVISEISLTEPHLTLRQTRDAKWVLVPKRPPRPATGRVPGAPGPHVRLPEYTLELRQFHVRDGRADIIDRKGRTLAQISGLTVDGKLDASRTITGDLWIDRINISDVVYPNRMRAHFVQAGDHLDVTDVKFAIADGKVRATFHAVAPHDAAPAFQLNGEMEDVSLPQLIAEAHGNDAGASGTVVGRFDLRGNPLDAGSLTGRGDFSLDAARLQPLDFIQQIGIILRVDELQMLNLKQATLRFDVKNERFLMNDLTFKTENLIITGKGPIRFDGKMNLAGRLMVNEKIQKQLGGLIGDNFTPSEDANYKQVAFSVTGHLDNPKTNLIEKVTGFEFRNMGGMLKGLFHLPKPEETPQKEEPADSNTTSANTPAGGP
ncbi:MAG: AsmA-like C-terminal region-containing protein [Terrimicrobiaceae bacterium]|nr:AsmA-like C-terminal region-containing protein [Terrimicrobiaceae bacterium]